MPLSEHEQRLLDQIERALYAEDPKFASAVRSTDLRSHLIRRIKRAIGMLVLGVVVLVAGAVVGGSAGVVVGVTGFVVMLVAGLVIARSAARINGGSTAPVARPSRRRGGPRTPWRERLEERWRRRWEDRGEQ